MNDVKPMLEQPTCGTTRAAKLLQVSVGTIHHMVERGELQAWFTSGGHRRISLESIRLSQMRRRMSLSVSISNSEVLRIAVIVDDLKVLAKLETMLIASRNFEKNIEIKFYLNPMKMILDLDVLNPNLILIDKSALNQIGGVKWCAQLRDVEKFKHTQVLVLSDMLDPADVESFLNDKVDVITEPFDESWVNGYIQALVTSCRLSW